MTVLIPVGRSWSVKVLPRSSHILTRLISTNSNSRVSPSQNSDKSSTRPQCKSLTVSTRFQQVRSFADGKPGRPAGRPKAHTGRSPAKRTTAKKAVAKPKAKPKSKAKKPVKAKAKAKAKPKVKAKPKKREPSATALKAKASKERTELRKQALLNAAPKSLPASAWSVFFVESGPKKGEALDKSGSRIKIAGQQYRTMSAEERERLNHIANQNKAKNEAAFKSWIATYTPLQIKQANHARDLLKQEAKKAGKKTQYAHIKDDRLVKLPANQYSMFLQDRYKTGDMKGMTIAEAGKLVSREWKDLNAAEKRAYNDRHAVDRNRYIEEHKTVYGIDPPLVANGGASASATA